ncbi:SagB-type dehydrogenase domain-containing protein [Trichlorobacter thiogenes]|uniref:SagB-type dehydrogenase domain-containing protein n=1 Tax=Trichlorobacter thiogenes TaxID=115783 RepID=A0A1T4P079_9BACT|nr:SagB/ThcOx family dehydrogenase [Trichlorobacter thiogenes]SJZ84903.1 SagB-type dehydrogenase domain-containing protein [Trichlorobacter thiogenes]
MKPAFSKKMGRWFLTDRVRDLVDWWGTPQSQGEEPPPVQKPVADGLELISLPERADWNIPSYDLVEAIASRESQRRFSNTPLRLDELAFLLWSTQGVRERLHGAAVLRTVPSAGCRHPFETYLVVLRVAGLVPGVYRYLPLDHALILESVPADLAQRITAATRGQRFAGQAAVTFVWSAIPARTEWRYAEASAKVIALDAGHVCQNLYLACGAIGCGTCAIAAYDQDLADALIGGDGNDEFVVYLSPVGKLTSI